MIRVPTCVHFRGIQHDVCNAGVRIKDVRVIPEHGPYRFPCVPKADGSPDNCPKRRMPTAEELAAEEAKFERAFAAVDAGRSPCCDAPLDLTMVDETGSGWRYCSKCKKAVLHGCGGGSDEGGPA